MAATVGERSAMRRQFNPYPHYKDSGVEWLGRIPAHWEVRRLKTIASVRLSNVDKKSVEGQEAVELCNYTDVYYNERITSNLEFMPATATREQMQRFSLRTGDVLITKDSESWMDIAVPAVVVEDLPGVLCGYHLAHIRPAAGYAGAFLSHAFAAVGPRDQFQIAANGITRFGLGGDAIRVGLFAVPPEAEQLAIVAFLGSQTARIDELVAKKERLIELLQEQRVALITRTVTEGLDPNVPRKDSGVEWLGQIPAHWQVKRVRKSCTRVTDGAHISPDTSSADFPFVSTVDVSGGVIDFDECLRTSASSYAYMERTGCRPKRGDVLFSKDGTVGTTAVVTTDREFAVASSLVILSPYKTELDAGWLNYWLNGGFIKDQVELLLSGAALRRISVTKVGRLPLLLPSLREQRAIAAFLDRETTRIDGLVAKVGDAIRRLRELRAALISAAVTGKIDVRKEAP